MSLALVDVCCDLVTAQKTPEIKAQARTTTHRVGAFLKTKSFE